MVDNENKSIILVKEDTDNVAYPIFFGTNIQCKGIMFDFLIPSENRRNLIRHDADYGYWFSYERLKDGEWKKVEVFLQTLPKEGVKNSGLIL